ncbi:hypothetical protein [Corallococcus sp. EGB]|uniref:hypothetical protein n=1 Tax=Corallococcus sp. EGB TaxID=1521117 RepID=UPI001CC081A5|nr:hypothetical protein [Corallococcus sp. EGB]
MKALVTCGLVLALGAVGCVDPEDSPDRVHDFRVLGLATERPELMAPSCDFTQADLDALREPVTFRALFADPAGGGRSIQYTLWACADVDDTTCADTANRVQLAEGSTTESELSVTIRPGDTQAQDGTPLLVRVREKDPYLGLGGLRMPLVLHARAGDEAVYAQKLMVFSCPIVEGMTANVNPELPGLRLDDAPWAVDAVPELKGQGPFVITVEDLTGLEEHYVVPGLTSGPVALTEAWKVSWHTTFGEFSETETGGADFGGEVGRHRTEWEPPEEGGSARDVTFWAVVRDGRGGQSWLTRRARWAP